MDESGLRNVDILSSLGLKSAKADDVMSYLRGRIKVSGILPIPSLVYDTATDIRWAEPPM